MLALQESNGAAEASPSSSSSAGPPNVVEVQKEAGSATWYLGHIVSLASETSLVVGFEADVWKPAEFPISRLRKPRKAHDPDQFNPQVGDRVELRVAATEYAPACWMAAVVRNIKQTFYFVARDVSLVASEGADSIVEKDMLRPPTGSEAVLSTGSLCQEIFKLPPQLSSWATSSDAAGCFGHIEEQSGLVYIGFSKGDLRLVGDKKATQRAQMLLQVHVRHQTQIQNFQDVREKRLKALEEKRNRIEGAGFKKSCEFKVKSAFVPRIIGKSGETISALEEKCQVVIRILDAEDGEDERIVRIFGADTESVAKARADVEYIEEGLPIETEMRRWVLGNAGRTLNHFKSLANLVSAKLDKDSRKLMLCGTRNAVEDAVAMFETHIMYYPVVNQMDEAMEDVIAQLEEYGDWNSRKEWEWWREELDQSYHEKVRKMTEKRMKEDGRTARAETSRKGGSKSAPGKVTSEASKGSGKAVGEASRRWTSRASESQHTEEWTESGNRWYNYRDEPYEEAAVGEGPTPRKRLAIAGSKADSEEATPPDSAAPAASSSGGGGAGKKGKGRGGKTAEAPSTGRAVWKAKEPKVDDERGDEVEDTSAAAKPAKPPLGTRRIGKKGVRSSADAPE